MPEETAQDKIGKLLSIDTAEDENVKGLVGELTNSVNIETKTDLNPNQIVVMSRAIWFARRYGIQPLDMYCRRVMMKVLVSKGRGGRKDIVDALSNVFRFAIEKQRNEQVKV